MSPIPSVGFCLRATRARPRGLAASGARRTTYGAALAQFDELMAAAVQASAASRPLPLFYALSQAGRAIAAALVADSWRLRLHGLSCPDLDGDLLAVNVHPAPREADGVVDSYRG